MFPIPVDNATNEKGVTPTLLTSFLNFPSDMFNNIQIVSYLFISKFMERYFTDFPFDCYMGTNILFYQVNVFLKKSQNNFTL